MGKLRCCRAQNRLDKCPTKTLNLAVRPSSFCHPTPSDPRFKPVRCTTPSNPKPSFLRRDTASSLNPEPPNSRVPFFEVPLAGSFATVRLLDKTSLPQQVNPTKGLLGLCFSGCSGCRAEEPNGYKPNKCGALPRTTSYIPHPTT